MGSRSLGIVRLFVYLAWTMILVPLQFCAMKLRSPLKRRLPRLYHLVCVRIFGFRIEVHGKPSTIRPTLFVSNHSSYLDITVLGSVINGSFVAKAEVSQWPFFGFLANLQETVYVNRKARHDAARQRDDMRSRLNAGDNLILFPEGTSSDGNRTLPFKSALFAVANMTNGEQPLTVQPVSITATHLDGVPLGWMWRALYAWYGDMDLAPHLWSAVQLRRLKIVVEFHPIVTIEEFSSRKALADHCWRVIAIGVDRAIGGRNRTEPSPAA
ncbi:Lyso-ornithine lipid O-acyltransferase [Azospirillaceae bacterium]